MLNYDITRMKHKVTFETVKSHENAMGVNVATPVEVATVWCGEYNNTMSQTYTNLGTHVSADLVLVIRHNPDVNKRLSAKYKGHEYKIIAINSDDRINAFDLITLQDKSGVSDNS